MAIEFVENDASGMVVLSGEVGVQEAQQLKSALEAALRKAGGLAVDMRKVTSIDASVVQLMHALTMAGGAVDVAGVSEEVSRQAAELGASGVGCGRVCGQPGCVLEQPGLERPGKSQEQ